MADVIKFPGLPEPEETNEANETEAVAESPILLKSPDGKVIELDANQAKALSLVISGVPFILIGIKEAGDGADYFTAVHGDKDVLYNSLDALPGVIKRAYERAGVFE